MDKREILLLLSKVIDIDVDILMGLPDDTKLVDIELDSLSFINFIVAVEEKYGFEVLDSDLLLSNFETIEKLLYTFRKYLTHESSIKKVLICDCDNCLWRGVSGEDRIYLDEDTVSLQKMIVKLYNSGVLICLCSKNDAHNIQTAFTTLSMPLKLEHIIISKINYRNKAANIGDIANELKLSLESFVFIDDSDYEIGLINALLPEVTTIKIDYTNTNLIKEIASYFVVQPYDLNRTQQYREQKEREKEKVKYNDVREYNESLSTVLCCDVASYEQAGRIAELSQRTNQFNLSGARYTKEDILLFLSSDNYSILFIAANDKFGDMGIVGMAVVRKERQAVIESFCLSCRVLGRGFEMILLDKIKKLVGTNLSGVLVKTEKNKPFQDFYIKNGVKIYE